MLGACSNSNGAHSETKAQLKALLTAGLKAQAKGEDSKADADYLTIVKAEPSNTIAWYDLGVIAQQHSLTTSAVHDYDRAIASNSTYVPAMYNLAIIDTKSHPKTAVQLYTRCVTDDPSDAYAWLNLGFLEKSLGNTAVGGADIAKATSLDPSLGSSASSSGSAK